MQLDAEGRVQDVVEEPALDAAVYGADRLYPAEIARVVDLGFMRSQRIVRLEVTPVQVNPVTGERAVPQGDTRHPALPGRRRQRIVRR